MKINVIIHNYRTLRLLEMYTVTHWEILQFKQLPLWYQKIYKKKMLKKSEKKRRCR